MHLLVGLGNPGPKYVENRHNVGFMVIERLAARLGGSAFREKFKGVTLKVPAGADDVVLLMPMTFMNLSGESVHKAMAFYDIPIERVLVVHDELDLEFADLRIKMGGGTAGHNGLRSMVQHCGGNDFNRLRFGIGRPRSGRPDAHVLSNFSAEERAELDDLIEAAVDMALAVVAHGPREAMNRFNRKG